MIAWQSPDVAFEPNHATINLTASQPDATRIGRQTYVVNRNLRDALSRTEEGRHPCRTPRRCLADMASGKPADKGTDDNDRKGVRSYANPSLTDLEHH